MPFEEQLKAIGLQKKEIRIYLYLLEQGLSTPPQVSKGTGIARTHCYNILRSLQDQQLIQEQVRGKRKAYIAQSPQSLLATLERKKQALEKLVPDLEALYTLQKNKPKILFYDGWEQVKDIYAQSLKAEEIFGVGSTAQLARLDAGFFIDYQQKLKERQIIMHEVITKISGASAGRETKNILKGLLDQSILPEKYHDFSTDILVWNNTIALITLEEPIFGTVIHNSSIAKTVKIIIRALQEGL